MGAATSLLEGLGSQAGRKASPVRNNGNASVQPWGHHAAHSSRGPWGPGAPRTPEQRCVGAKACRTGAAEWWALGEGHAPCAWLFGKSIVLLLLTKSQATCKSWLESTTGLADWVIRFPSPTVLPIPPSSPPWHGPNVLLGGGKQQCWCIESAVCRAQFMHHLNTG